MAKKKAAYWDKRAERREDAAQKAVDPRVAELERVYDIAEKQVTAEINKIYRTYAKGNGVDLPKLNTKLSIEETHAFWLKMKRDGHLPYIAANYQARITRLEQIKGDIYAKVREITPQELEINTATHTETINTAYNQTQYEVSKGLNTNIVFGGLNEGVLNTMLNQEWLGANYSKRIWKNTDLLATSVKDQLSASLLTGQSPLKLTDSIAEQFGVSKGAAKRLIRTETNYFQNESDAISAEDIGLDQYKYLATLDTRTSQTCRLHDNKIYEYKKRVVGTNFPPLHPHCRSTTRPYLGDDYEPDTRAARDENGKHIQVANMSYEQWYELNDVQNYTPSKPPVVANPKPKA